MLYIIHNNGVEINWHVGQKTNEINLSARSVTEIQADGHELEYIHDKIKNIPFVNHQRVINWFGDHAKFIIRNL